MKRWWIGKVAAGIGMFVVAALLVSFLVMLLWNALIPDIFHGPALTYGQALGLLVLSHILLRGGGPWMHRGGWRRDRWRKRFDEKMASMTPEEREKFREAWHHRCGWEPGESPETKAPQSGADSTT